MAKKCNYLKKNTNLFHSSSASYSIKLPNLPTYRRKKERKKERKRVQQRSLETQSRMLHRRRITVITLEGNVSGRVYDLLENIPVKREV